MSANPRNQVVMYADVAGSATLFERLGDTEAIHAVERCLKRMKRSIDGYRGRTMQTAGDELLAAFETAEDACQAAIDMQQRIADLPRRLWAEVRWWREYQERIPWIPPRTGGRSGAKRPSLPPDDGPG